MGKTFKDKNKWNRKRRDGDEEDRVPERKYRKGQVDEPDPMDLLDEEEDSWWDEYYLDD